MGESLLHLVSDDSEWIAAEEAEVSEEEILRKQLATDVYNLVGLALEQEHTLQNSAEPLKRSANLPRPRGSDIAQKVYFEEGGRIRIHHLYVRAGDYSDTNLNTNNLRFSKILAEPYTGDSRWFDQLSFYLGPSSIGVVGVESMSINAKKTNRTCDLVLPPKPEFYRMVSDITLLAVIGKPFTNTRNLLKAVP